MEFDVNELNSRSIFATARTKVYIASSSAFAIECEDLASYLENVYGFEITRKWWKHYIKDAPAFKDMPDDEFYQHPQVQAVREYDYRAVREADIVIVICHYPGKALTGSLLEAGYAIAHHKIVIFYGKMKRSAMVSGCIHVEKEKQLFELLDRLKG